MRRPDLIAKGFCGFLAIDQWDTWIDQTPRDPGAYVVLRVESGVPKFLALNKAGQFKGRKPTVPVARLKKRWVPDADVLYIGSATKLQDRVRKLCRFMEGTPVDHWGGRFLWQVAGFESFPVAWLPEPGRDPLAVERELMCEFRDRFGSWPFANIRGPRC